MSFKRILRFANSHGWQELWWMIHTILQENNSKNGAIVVFEKILFAYICRHDLRGFVVSSVLDLSPIICLPLPSQKVKVLCQTWKLPSCFQYILLWCNHQFKNGRYMIGGWHSFKKHMSGLLRCVIFVSQNVCHLSNWLWAMFKIMILPKQHFW